jgi:hypothetical protein
MQREITGKPLLERIMVRSVGEKTRLPDDFAEKYLLFTNSLIDSASSSFMVAEIEEGGCGSDECMTWDDVC